MRKWALLFSLSAAAGMVACGGGNSPTPVASTPAPTSGNSGTPSPTPTPITTAQVVTVGAGQDVGGIDVNVSAPADSPQPNAEMLGVTDVNSGGSAQNTGATIHRGSTMKVLLFGAGLNGSMTVNIGGAQDIAISNVHSIMSTDNTPGVAFTAAVSGSAALGARTVILRTAKGDVTTFTGGLEVIP